MGLPITLVFYLLVGLSVATAVFLSAQKDHGADRLFRVATSVVFWPLYLPIVLTGTIDSKEKNPSPPKPCDAMAEAIAQVESELDAALSRLDGWAEDVLARERDRIRELRAAWNTQAARVREMDQLLQQPGFADGAAHEPDQDPTAGERCRQSLEARRANIERLAAVRRRAYDELMGTLAWVRELVSMIHLAKFTGAPPSRAEELVAQIAAAVEGISQVTWQEEVPLHDAAADRVARRTQEYRATDPLAGARG
jgi:hypothetical protein